MKSETTASFRDRLERLSPPIQCQARRQFERWRADSKHPSLQFKEVWTNVWSARISLNYRALARFREGTYYWFWIGPHAEYDQLLKRLD